MTTAAAYLDHALNLPTTRVVALFLETVREPAAFRAALAKAASRAIPVVALKVGRGQAARAMVAAHSGALAGEEGAYQALFDAYGVAQVATLDELADTCELLSGRRAHRGGLAAVLEPGLPATNPLDAWGRGNDADEIFATCIRAVLEDPATAALALNLDLTTEPTPTPAPHRPGHQRRRHRQARGRAGQPGLGRRPGGGGHTAGRGVPVLEGTATGLSALRHLLAHRDFLAREAAAGERAARETAAGAGAVREGLWTARRSGDLGRLRSPTGGPDNGGSR